MMNDLSNDNQNANQNAKQLVQVVVREYTTATGGHTITDAQARALITRTLAGRHVSSPAAYLIAAIRTAPDPHALLDDPPPARRPPTPCYRPASQVIPNYARRVAAVRAAYAEADRRRAIRAAATRPDDGGEPEPEPDPEF